MGLVFNPTNHGTPDLFSHCSFYMKTAILCWLVLSNRFGYREWILCNILILIIIFMCGFTVHVRQINCKKVFVLKTIFIVFIQFTFSWFNLCGQGAIHKMTSIISRNYANVSHFFTNEVSVKTLWSTSFVQWYDSEPEDRRIVILQVSTGHHWSIEDHSIILLLLSS